MSVTLHTTVGDLKMELFCEQTPKSAMNFIAHCASGYFDNTVFHRNMPGFMLQGGDPTKTGKGGESIYGGYFEDEFVDDIKPDERGLVCMANKNKPGTNGSQFFFLYQPQEHLHKMNTIFGKIIDGMDTLSRIESMAGKEFVMIEKITIHANPFAQNE